MELRHLRYFIAVAEELHFSRAAQRLSIAQPPLSQQIKNLEGEVGVQLLRRTRRHVELTEAGQIFLEEARRAVAQAEQAVSAARRASRGEIGRLTLGFVGSATYTVLPHVLRSFRKRYPAVEVTLRELTTSQQIDALSAGEVDLGIVRQPPIRENLVSRVLVDEHFVVALSRRHRAARQKSVHVSTLAEDPFILFPRPLATSLHDAVVSACQRAGFSPKIVQEATQIPVMISLVAASLGVAIVPSCAQALKWNNVVYKPLEDPQPRTNIALVWRKQSESATVAAFVANAVQAMGAAGHPRLSQAQSGR
jgi:DNA-binding transcriptional LysR family regulator